MIKKVPFKEICETVAGIDNTSSAIKITRLFVRYLTRIVGYSVAAKILGLMLLLVKRGLKKRSIKYIWYILEINKIRIEYLNCLSNNNLLAAVFKKNQWAELALRDSMSLRSRWDAKGYLSLLSRHGFHHMKYDGCRVGIERVSEKIFYIYGPNASTMPSSKYKEYMLVLTKPIDLDISLYKENILFINSIYYNNVVCKNEKLKNDLIKKYGEIYVSCREALLSGPFIRAKFPMGGNISSPMSLGRVLYNLMRRYGKFSCVIDGFDFYLDSAMYQSYYPTLARDKNKTVSEQVICSSLADHDALYNFLYVKEMVGMLDIVDSTHFKKIIDLSGERYLDELSKVRKFESLR